MANEPPDSWLRDAREKFSGKEDPAKIAETLAKNPNVQAKIDETNQYDISARTATPMTKKPDNGGGNGRQLTPGDDKPPTKGKP